MKTPADPASPETEISSLIVSERAFTYESSGEMNSKIFLESVGGGYRLEETMN